MERLVLDEKDDATVLARAVARVTQVLPVSALGSAVELLVPTRAQGKARRSLGTWELQLRADSSEEMERHKAALVEAGFHSLESMAALWKKRRKSTSNPVGMSNTFCTGTQCITQSIKPSAVVLVFSGFRVSRHSAPFLMSYLLPWSCEFAGGGV